jgi:hypothetical protein
LYTISSIWLASKINFPSRWLDVKGFFEIFYTFFSPIISDDGLKFCPKQVIFFTVNAGKQTKKYVELERIINYKNKKIPGLERTFLEHIFQNHPSVR